MLRTLKKIFVFTLVSIVLAFSVNVNANPNSGIFEVTPKDNFQRPTEVDRAPGSFVYAYYTVSNNYTQEIPGTLTNTFRRGGGIYVDSDIFSDTNASGLDPTGVRYCGRGVKLETSGPNNICTVRVKVTNWVTRIDNPFETLNQGYFQVCHQDAVSVCNFANTGDRLTVTAVDGSSLPLMILNPNPLDLIAGETKATRVISLVGGNAVSNVTVDANSINQCPQSFKDQFAGFNMPNPIACEYVDATSTPHCTINFTAKPIVTQSASCQIMINAGNAQPTPLTVNIIGPQDGPKVQAEPNPLQLNSISMPEGSIVVFNPVAGTTAENIKVNFNGMIGTGDGKIQVTSTDMSFPTDPQIGECGNIGAAKTCTFKVIAQGNVSFQSQGLTITGSNITAYPFAINYTRVGAGQPVIDAVPNPLELNSATKPSGEIVVRNRVDGTTAENVKVHFNGLIGTGNGKIQVTGLNFPTDPQIGECGNVMFNTPCKFIVTAQGNVSFDSQGLQITSDNIPDPYDFGINFTYVQPGQPFLQATPNPVALNSVNGRSSSVAVSNVMTGTIAHNVKVNFNGYIGTGDGKIQVSGGITFPNDPQIGECGNLDSNTQCTFTVSTTSNTSFNSQGMTITSNDTAPIPFAVNFLYVQPNQPFLQAAPNPLELNSVTRPSGSITVSNVITGTTANNVKVNFNGLVGTGNGKIQVSGLNFPTDPQIGECGNLDINRQCTFSVTTTSTTSFQGQGMTITSDNTVPVPFGINFTYVQPSQPFLQALPNPLELNSVNRRSGQITVSNVIDRTIATDVQVHFNGLIGTGDGKIQVSGGITFPNDPQIGVCGNLDINTQCAFTVSTTSNISFQSQGMTITSNETTPVSFAVNFTYVQPNQPFLQATPNPVALNSVNGRTSSVTVSNVINSTTAHNVQVHFNGLIGTGNGKIQVTGTDISFPTDPQIGVCGNLGGATTCTFTVTTTSNTSFQSQGMTITSNDTAPVPFAVNFIYVQPSQPFLQALPNPLELNSVSRPSGQIAVSNVMTGTTARNVQVNFNGYIGTGNGKIQVTGLTFPTDPQIGECGTLTGGGASCNFTVTTTSTTSFQSQGMTITSDDTSAAPFGVNFTYVQPTQPSIVAVPNPLNLFSNVNGGVGTIEVYNNGNSSTVNNVTVNFGDLVSTGKISVRINNVSEPTDTGSCGSIVQGTPCRIEVTGLGTANFQSTGLTMTSPDLTAPYPYAINFIYVQPGQPSIVATPNPLNLASNVNGGVGTINVYSTGGTSVSNVQVDFKGLIGTGDGKIQVTGIPITGQIGSCGNITPTQHCSFTVTAGLGHVSFNSPPLDMTSSDLAGPYTFFINYTYVPVAPVINPVVTVGSGTPYAFINTSSTDYPWQLYQTDMQGPASYGLASDGTNIVSVGTVSPLNNNPGGIQIKAISAPSWVQKPVLGTLPQFLRWNAVAVNGSTWVVAGGVYSGPTDVGLIAISTDNGKTWAVDPLPAGTRTLFGISWSQARNAWVAVGSRGTIMTKGTAPNAPWVPDAGPAGAAANFTSVSCSPTTCIAAGTIESGYAMVYINTTGTSWTRQGNNTLFPTPLSAIAYDGISKWVAVGNDEYIVSYQGQTQTWTVELARNPQAAVLTGVTWNGSSWVAVGTQAKVFYTDPEQNNEWILGTSPDPSHTLTLNAVTAIPPASTAKIGNGLHKK